MTAPATSMLSAKLKIAQSKPIGVDVEVDEVADVAEDQAVVAVAQGPGHDQAQRDRQRQAGRGPADEEPVADRERRRGPTARRRSGCCTAALRPKPQRAPVLWLV